MGWCGSTAVAATTRRSRSSGRTRPDRSATTGIGDSLHHSLQCPHRQSGLGLLHAAVGCRVAFDRSSRGARKEKSQSLALQARRPLAGSRVSIPSSPLCLQRHTSPPPPSLDFHRHTTDYFIIKYTCSMMRARRPRVGRARAGRHAIRRSRTRSLVVALICMRARHDTRKQAMMTASHRTAP